MSENDLNWNLIPTVAQVNSIKSDRLPNLDLYLEPFCDLQYKFLQFLNNNSRHKIIEDYCFLLKLRSDHLSNIDYNLFKNKLSEIIIPIEQIAANNGFARNWKYDLL